MVRRGFFTCRSMGETFLTQSQQRHDRSRNLLNSSFQARVVTAASVGPERQRICLHHDPRGCGSRFRMISEVKYQTEIRTFALARQFPVADLVFNRHTIEN